MCNGQCQAILKTGPNKGNQCGNYATNSSGLCGVHQRSARKNKVLPLPVMYVVIGTPVETPIAELEMAHEKSRVRRWLCM